MFTGQTNYYSKSAGNLNLLATWGTNTDGSGTAPVNFTTANQIFNIRNTANPTIGANWTVSGAGSKVIVGDGTAACTFTIPGTLIFTSNCDVSDNGTLKITSTAVSPYAGTLIVNIGGTYQHAEMEEQFRLLPGMQAQIVILQELLQYRTNRL